MELGKTYTSEKYPWSISGHWWKTNGMKALCASHKACTNADIDVIGARVNGRMRPNGADDRISYTDRAYSHSDRRLAPFLRRPRLGLDGQQLCCINALDLKCLGKLFAFAMACSPW